MLMTYRNSQCILKMIIDTFNLKRQGQLEFRFKQKGRTKVGNNV